MGPLISGNSRLVKYYLGGGFKHFLFSPPFGEDSHFDEYFPDALKPPTSYNLVRYIIIPEILQFCCYNEIYLFERSSSRGTFVKLRLFQLKFPG